MAKVASILPADIAAVRQLLDEEGTPPRVQVEVWLALWSLNYGPRWALQCMAEAERLADLMEREAAVRSRLAALQASAGAAAVPPTLPPRRCYYWLGPRLGVKSDRLNECILNLAAASLIAHSREQLDALRRGLGLTLCAAEEGTTPPWVYWLGPVDVLWLLVDGLFRLGVIDCSGGPRMKWRTATGIFLHADGSPFDTTLKNSRCTNPEKHKLLQNLVFTPLEDAIAHRGA